MENIAQKLIHLKNNPKNVKFSELCNVCDFYFGEPRQSGSSHRVYKMPLKDWRSKMPIKNDHYTYRVTWSADDEEYVGLCTEFPGLSWMASTPEAALKGIRNVVADVVEDMQTNNEKIPEPIAIKNYSGKFMVRVPPEIHRVLALKAAEAGVSLNRLASSKLSQ